MRFFILLIGITLQLSASAQNFKLEEKLLDCIHKQGQQNGIDVKYQFMKYERMLQNKEIITDKSGESYYQLFKEVSEGKSVDLSSPYSLIDSLRSSIENFGKEQTNVHECIEKAKKIIESKAMQKTKLHELNRKLIILQFTNKSTPPLVAKNIINTLSPTELNHDFYKYISLAHLYYASNYGLSQVIAPHHEEKMTTESRTTILHINVRESIDSVYLNGCAVSISSLKDSIIDYFVPKPKCKIAPEVETVEIDLIGELERVKLSIELQSKFSTPFTTYINVTNIIADVYKQLRSELAFIHFGLTFEQLENERQRKAIIEAVPKNYSELPPVR